MSKLHALAIGRMCHATFLSNSTFLLCQHKLWLSEINSPELWVLWTCVLACRTDKQYLCDPTLQPKETEKPQCPGQGLKDEPCTPDSPIHTMWVIYVLVHIVCYVALGQGYTRLTSWCSHFFKSYWVNKSLVRNPKLFLRPNGARLHTG